MAAQSLLLQPALSAGFGYAGSRFVLGNTGSVSVGGTSIDKNIAVAVTSAASALVANIGKDYIIPKIPIVDPTMKGYAQKAVGPVLAGTSAVVLEKVNF